MLSDEVYFLKNLRAEDSEIWEANLDERNLELMTWVFKLVESVLFYFIDSFPVPIALN